MTTRASILLAIAALLSVGAAAPAQSYFPLVQGATWVRRGDDGAQVTARVVGPKTVGSVRCTVIETKSVRPDRERITRNCYVSSTRDVLLIEAEAAGRAAVLNPPRPVMLLPATQGKTWTWSPKNAPVELNWADQWIGEETARVPAGTFRAWKLKSVMKRGDATFILETWYALGVGIVKIEREVTRPGMDQEGKSELVSYKIP